MRFAAALGDPMTDWDRLAHSRHMSMQYAAYALMKA